MSKQELIEKAVLLFGGKWIFPFKNLCTPAETNTCYAPHSMFESIRNVSELGPNWIFVCTEHEFNSVADRMRGKPDWSTLPAKAEWLAQDRCGIWKPMQGRTPTIEEGSYWVTDHHLQPQLRGTVIGDWRNTLEKRPEQKVETMGEAINIAMTNAANKMASDLRYLANAQAPAKPWFEAGELPPIGQKCERSIGLNKWCETIIFAHSPDMAYAAFYDGKGMGWADNCKFRPIKTDKEKAIEFALGKINNGMNRHAAPYIIEQLYDAGLLRLPDPK